MNSATNTATETALATISTCYTVIAHRVLADATSGYTVVQAIVHAGTGLGRLVAFDAGDVCGEEGGVLELTKRARPVADLRAVKAAKGAKIVRDWT
jgi:hypothetical protein